MGTQCLAYVRKDLIARKLSVPVGGEYFSKRKRLKYRWKNNDSIFQVFLNNRWQTAESIDWDFL